MPGVLEDLTCATRKAKLQNVIHRAWFFMWVARERRRQVFNVINKCLGMFVASCHSDVSTGRWYVQVHNLCKGYVPLGGMTNTVLSRWGFGRGAKKTCFVKWNLGDVTVCDCDVCFFQYVSILFVWSLCWISHVVYLLDMNYPKRNPRLLAQIGSRDHQSLQMKLPLITLRVQLTCSPTATLHLQHFHKPATMETQHVTCHSNMMPTPHSQFLSGFVPWQPCICPCIFSQYATKCWHHSKMKLLPDVLHVCNIYLHLE